MLTQWDGDGPGGGAHGEAADDGQRFPAQLFPSKEGITQLKECDRSGKYLFH